jgi:PhnB protein
MRLNEGKWQQLTGRKQLPRSDVPVVGRRRTFYEESRPTTPNIVKTSLAPLLSVRRGTTAIDFYKRAFGAEELFRIESDKGEVVARMTVEGADFWLADESPQHFNFSPESLGGGSVRMVLTVENPDAVFERAVAAGASLVWPVADQPYGWRVGRIVDPFGHHWEIGKPLTGCT